jgi:predicted protein tyrosine phosphatase
MFVDVLQRRLHVCGHSEVGEILEAEPGLWSVVSIREPDHPKPDLTHAKRSCEAIFLDLEVALTCSEGEPPGPSHIKAIFEFADAMPAAPLLLHCFAGRSRSTGVALALIVRALWTRQVQGPALVTQAVDLLLAIRPYASPNSLVLRHSFELLMPPEAADRLAKSFVNEPRLAQNRTGFIP